MKKKMLFAKNKLASAILLPTICFLSVSNNFLQAESSSPQKNAYSSKSFSETIEGFPKIYNLWITLENTKQNNKLHLIIHNNPRMHSALVSIVFKVGRIDSSMHENSIAEIIAQHLISKKLHEKLFNIVCNYHVNCENEYTEIRAEVLPDKVKDFFLAFDGMLDSLEIDEKDLEDCKEKIIIRNKLRVYNKANAISDNLLSRIYPNTVFNESALRSITTDDVKKFFEEHYKNGVVLLTVCGDCDWIPSDSEHKRIAEIFHADADGKSDLNEKNQQAASNFDNVFKRNIFISNKYMSNAITYSYVIPPKKGDESFIKNERAFLEIFANELFRNLSKSNEILSYFNIGHLARREKHIFSVTLVPRSDISLNEIKKRYELFVKKISSQELSKERLEKIAKISETSYNFLMCDLYELNSYITDNYIAGKYDMAPAIISKNISAQQIKDFAENILMKNQFSELTTRYRTDK